MAQDGIDIELLERLVAQGGFPAMLAQNPSGWGGTPPIPQTAMQKEPWKYQGEMRNQRRPQEYTAPLAEMTPPVIPGLGLVGRGAAAVANAVRPAMAPAAAAGGMLAMMPEASVGGDSPLQQLYSQRSQLMEQRNKAATQRDAEASTGKGPNWQAADAEVRRLDAQLSGLDGLINDEQKRNSPEHQLEMQRKADELAAEQKAREAATPFRERYPEVAGALPIAGLALSAGLPFALKGKANLGTFMPGSYPSRVAGGIRRAEGAISGGNADDIAISGGELGQLIAAQPSRGSGLASAFGAAGAGGLLAAEAGMFPDQYDAFNLPPGPEQEQARERALDPMEYGKRGLMGALTGFSGYKAGGLVPSRTANIPRATALRDFIANRPNAPMGAPNRVVTRVRGKDGRVRYHDEAGNFTSGPRRGDR